MAREGLQEEAQRRGVPIHRIHGERAARQQAAAWAAQRGTQAQEPHYEPSNAVRSWTERRLEPHDPVDTELGPDAMRWSPQAGEHEMSAWEDLFHDRRREGRRDRPR